MAQNITEIKKEITDDFMADAAIQSIYGFPSGSSFDNEFSEVSFENKLFSINASSSWKLQKLFDEFKAAINLFISQMKPHTVRWYAKQALLFQYGYALVPDETYYDNSSLSQSQIEASKIVKYAAVNEVLKGLRIKVAKTVNNDLAPLTTQELNGFIAYMQAIKDAGVRLYIQSTAADSLRQTLDIYYDANILDAQGQRLDGTNNTPVQDAIRNYLQNLPFNGLFVHALYIDALQKIDGVVIPHIVSSEARYGILPYQPITVEYTPDAGYLRILNPSDLTLNFIPHAPIL